MPQHTATQVAPSTAGLSNTPSMAYAGGADKRVTDRLAAPNATPRPNVTTEGA